MILSKGTSTQYRYQSPPGRYPVEGKDRVRNSCGYGSGTELDLHSMDADPGGLKRAKIRGESSQKTDN
jgi:hypothetical protein